MNNIWEYKIFDVGNSNDCFLSYGVLIYSSMAFVEQSFMHARQTLYLHFDIRKRSNTTPKSIVLAFARKYASPKIRRNGNWRAKKAHFYQWKSFGSTSLSLWSYVHRVLARTALGCQAVRPEVAWPYVHRIFEWPWTENERTVQWELHKSGWMCILFWVKNRTFSKCLFVTRTYAFGDVL